MIKKLMCLCLLIILMIIPVSAANYTYSPDETELFDLSKGNIAPYLDAKTEAQYCIDAGYMGATSYVHQMALVNLTGGYASVYYPHPLNAIYDDTNVSRYEITFDDIQCVRPSGLIGRIQSPWHYNDSVFTRDDLFTATPTTGEGSNTVDFVNRYFVGNAATFNWGDGTSWTKGATLSDHYGNTSHLYLAGNYSVSMTVAGHTKLKSDYIKFNTPDYYCTASPAYIPNTQDYYVYGQVHGINTTKIIGVHWSFRKHTPDGTNEVQQQFLEINSSSKTVNYYKYGSNFMGYDLLNNSFNINKGLTLPNPVTLNPIGQTGIIHVNCKAYLEDKLTVIDNSMDVLIGGTNVTGMKNIRLHSKDGLTGAGLNPTTFSVNSLNDNKWTNVTSQSSFYNFSFIDGTILNIYADVTGYNRASSLGYQVVADDVKYMTLYQSNATGNNNLVINVLSEPSYNNGLSTPISSANVKLSAVNNASDIQYGSTNSVGVVTFPAMTNTDYTIEVSKSLYNSAVKVINTGLSNPYVTTVYMTLESVNPTPTQPTPTHTITVKPTYIGGDEKNTTAAVCGEQSDNIVQNFKNNIACWGIPDRTTQDLALAAIIILFCAYFVGRYAKGLGATIGAAIGFVLSIAAGLIDVWILFAFVIIAGLIFGLKLYNAGKD